MLLRLCAAVSLLGAISPHARADLPGLRREFASPSIAAGPAPVWRIGGARLDQRRLEFQLEQFAHARIARIIISPLAPTDPLAGPRVAGPTTRSAAWWAIMDRLMRRARGLGLRVLLDDPFAASEDATARELAAADPACRATDIRVDERDVRGPTEARIGAEGRTIAAFALPLDGRGTPGAEWRELGPARGPGRIVALPAGHWRVVQFVETAGGFDYLSAPGCRRLIERLYADPLSRLRRHLGRTVVGVVREALPRTNRWSSGMPALFRKLYGYDLLASLPHLIYDLGPSSALVRRDYADARFEMANSAYLLPIRRLLAASGLGLQAAHRRGAATPADPVAVRLLAALGGTRDGVLAPGAFAASANSTEGSGWGETLEEMGAELRGPLGPPEGHTTLYTTLAGWFEVDPPCVSFRQPYWRHYALFSDYARRIEALHSLGVARREVALLYPSAAIAAGGRLNGSATPGRAPVLASFHKSLEALSRAGIDFDVITEEHVAGVGLRSAGRPYRGLVMVATGEIPFTAAERIAAAARAGMVIAAVGNPPTTDTDNGALPVGVRAALAAIPVAASPDAAVNAMLARIGRDGSVAEFVERRETQGATLFLVTGSGGRTTDVRLRAAGAAELWNPWTGRTRPAASRMDGPGRITVSLPFGDCRTFGVVVRPGAALATPAAVARPSAQVYPATIRSESAASAANLERIAPMPIPGDWDVTPIPTLDNRWGDFAVPPSAQPVSIECRSYAYRQEGAQEDGIALGWHRPAAVAANWRSATATYGPYWWLSRPGVPEGSLALPAMSALDWRPDGADWEQAVYSQRFGIEKDRAIAASRGPRGRVPDEFLDLGTQREGTVRFAVSALASPEPTTVRVLSGGTGETRVAVNGVWLDDSSASAVRLFRGFNAIVVRMVHPAGRPLRAFVAFARPNSGATRPAWIWTGETPGAETRLFRRTFDIRTVPNRARLTIAADNACEAFINGIRVDSSAINLRTADWSVADTHDVTRLLRPGRNVLAVRVTNFGGPAGLLAELRTGAPPRALTVTDGSWRWSRTQSSGWDAAAFDDRRWQPVRVLGLYPAAPWGAIHGFADAVSAALPGSGWLNPRVIGWPEGMHLDVWPGIGKHVGWLRFRIPAGARTLKIPAAGKVRVFLGGRECTVLDGGIVEVPMDLQSAGTLCALRIEETVGRYAGAALDGPVTFEVGTGRSAPGDWTLMGLPHFSGGLRYERSVDLTEAAVAALTSLDLGRVRGTAELTVNGRPAGVRLWRPYRFDLSGLLRPGPNRLAVTVYNTLAPQFGSGSPTPYVFPGQERSGMFGPVRLVAGRPAGAARTVDTSGLTNFALASEGASATASSEHRSGRFGVDTILSGETSGERWANGGGWCDDTPDEFPDWVVVHLASPQTLQAATLITLAPAERYGVAALEVECWEGGRWVLRAQAEDLAQERITLRLPGVVTDRVRLRILASNDEQGSRIVAVQLWGRPQE